MGTEEEQRRPKLRNVCAVRRRVQNTVHNVLRRTTVVEVHRLHVGLCDQGRSYKHLALEGQKHVVDVGQAQPIDRTTKDDDD